MKKRRPRPSVPARERIVVGVYFRLPPRIVDRLHAAAGDRFDRDLSPWSQQDIVAEALDKWLAARGY